MAFCRLVSWPYRVKIALVYGDADVEPYCAVFSCRYSVFFQYTEYSVSVLVVKYWILLQFLRYIDLRIAYYIL